MVFQVEIHVCLHLLLSGFYSLYYIYHFTKEVACPPLPAFSSLFISSYLSCIPNPTCSYLRVLTSIQLLFGHSRILQYLSSSKTMSYSSGISRGGPLWEGSPEPLQRTKFIQGLWGGVNLGLLRLSVRSDLVLVTSPQSKDSSP